MSSIPELRVVSATDRGHSLGGSASVSFCPLNARPERLFGGPCAEAVREGGRVDALVARTTGRSCGWPLCRVPWPRMIC